MANIQLEKVTRVSAFRRLALGTWRTSYDPQVYGQMDLRMEQALRYVEEYRRVRGRRLTVTHMLGRAVAEALVAAPEMNSVIRFNRPYHRRHVDIFFQVSMETEDGKSDLSGTTLRKVEQKGLETLIDEMEAKVKLVRERRDPELEKTRASFGLVPYLLLFCLLRILGFFLYTMNWSLKWAGVPRDAFGSAMITNIGSLGLEAAYAPLVPYSRVPLVLAMGAVADRAVVDNGQIVPAKVMSLYATFDHRLMEGATAAVMSKVVKGWMENPYEHFGPIEPVERGDAVA